MHSVAPFAQEKHLKRTANQISGQLQGGFKSELELCEANGEGLQNATCVARVWSQTKRESWLKQQHWEPDEAAQWHKEVRHRFVVHLSRLCVVIYKNQNTLLNTTCITCNQLHRQEFVIFLSSAAASLSLRCRADISASSAYENMPFLWRLIAAMKPCICKKRKKKQKHVFRHILLFISLSLSEIPISSLQDR